MISIILFFITNIAGYILPFISAPILAFSLYQLLYFFYPHDRWWGTSVPDISYSFFSVLLMITILFLNFKQFNNNKILSIPQFKWAYLFAFIYGITSFYAIFPELHADALTYFIKLLIIISIAYKLCDSNKALNIALYSHIAGAWYMGFYIFQVGRNHGSRVERIGTVDSPDANGMAATIAPALVLCLYYFFISKKITVKMLFVLAGIFIANALILINSRGAFLGAAVGILLFMYHLYFSKYSRKHQKKLAVFITIAGLSVAGYLADDSFKARMFGIEKQINVNKNQESGGTRMYYWLGAIEMAKDYPFGKGYRAFVYYSPFYLPQDLNTGASRNRAVHSSWFEALSETGYLGLIAFIMIIYSSFKTLNICKKVLNEKEDVDNYFKIIAIQAALVTFIISMTFLNRMRAEILYWLILYTACAYNIFVLKNVNSDKKDTDGASNIN